MGLAAVTEAQTLRGRVLDDESETPLAGVIVQARPQARADAHELLPTQTRSDTDGSFALDLSPGRWRLEATRIGFSPVSKKLTLTGDGSPQLVLLRLQPRPLMLDGMLVRTHRRQGEGEAHTAGFVETIEVGQEQRAGADLPGLLDRALGLEVRRYGGLGSSASVSIRGSTAEQVLVFLDGVPMNQASGGGVDLGYLPLAGVEQIEIYRGSVPIRFGGNSIGGVVHMRTAAATGRQTRLYANAGSFATRSAGGHASGEWGPWQLMGLADYRAADNDFRFWDDNGTEYNPADDEWARRANSDFLSFRGLVKVSRHLGARRLHLHSIVDLSQRGIPGIGNYQSLHTRYGTWRSITEAGLSGPIARHAAYRVTGYHTLDVGEYEDPLGEVGIGSAHDRNTTRSVGLKAEGHTLLPARVLLTGYSALRRETFKPEDLLGVDEPFEDSRRHAASLAVEAEIPVHGDRLLLNAGAHTELLDDHFASDDTPAANQGPREESTVVRGFHFGGRWQLSERLSLRANGGSYQRPPSFFELFGDRGAVRGNAALENEEGWNWDGGLTFEAQQPGRRGLTFAEVAGYRNRVDDMIRFVQNSQFVSQSHNIGRARLSGIEARASVRLHPALQVNGNYVYQHAENRSPFSYEKGNDLPNAPPHALNGRAVATWGWGTAHYEISRESSHFLDRANLRPVAARALHGAGAGIQVAAATQLTLEVRNLTDNRAADLWGFPLPGRSFFASVQIDISDQMNGTQSQAGPQSNRSRPDATTYFPTTATSEGGHP